MIPVNLLTEPDDGILLFVFSTGACAEVYQRCSGLSAKEYQENGSFESRKRRHHPGIPRTRQ